MLEKSIKYHTQIYDSQKKNQNYNGLIGIDFSMFEVKL